MSRKKKEQTERKKIVKIILSGEKQKQNMYSRNTKQSKSFFCSKQDVSSDAEMDFWIHLGAVEHHITP